MQKPPCSLMKMTRMVWLGFVLAWVMPHLCVAAGNVWVVYGDYGNTVRSNNVNRFDTRVNSTPHPLTNFYTGILLTNFEALPIMMYSTNANSYILPPGTACTNPTDGPLTAYTNILNFGGQNIVQIVRTNTNSLVFINLDPGFRYKFIAGVSRGNSPGNSSFSNRWSKAWISGADSYTPNHQQGQNSPYGVLTTNNITETGVLSGSEVVWNAGCNLWGDLIEWDDIDPGPDGTFAVNCTQFYWTSPITSHGTYTGTFTPNSANNSYSWDGWALIAEYACTSFTMGFPLPQEGGETNITQCVPWSITMSPRCGVPPYTFSWNKIGESEDRAGSFVLESS